MVVEETAVDVGIATQRSLRFTPISRATKSDVHFPLTTPGRKRAPSLSSMTNVIDQDTALPDERLTLRVKAVEDADLQPWSAHEDHYSRDSMSRLSLDDLPPEVHGRILDYLFGDMHAVTASTTLQSTHVSSSMRHPRRKAVSDLAYISPTWRELVQERIYRHIKIKGTRAGLQESQNYWCMHPHLTRHVRHIEFWVPVWGDKASLPPNIFEHLGQDHGSTGFFNTNNALTSPKNDPLGINFKLSICSATLSEIFLHIADFFPDACIFTLEGGHCKNSHMIRHFPRVLFNTGAAQHLEKLPQIRTFAMRGAWNIMREYSDWNNIQAALPNLEEWHCGYAKPRSEANLFMNRILLRPPKLNHLNIILDGMYSKDNGSPTLASSESSTPSVQAPHLCDPLGWLAPELETLSYTGRICSCFWEAAIDSVRMRLSISPQFESRLHAVEIIVKSCCRPRPPPPSPSEPDGLQDLADPTDTSIIFSDSPTITNLSFIRAFANLVHSTILALPYFPHLKYIRIRFIDLDSPCTLLNPYWQLKNNVVNGIWNHEIVEALEAARPEARYEELGDGLGDGWISKEDEEQMFSGQHATWLHPGVGNAGWHAMGPGVHHAAGQVNTGLAAAVNGWGGPFGNGQSTGQGASMWSALYPKTKPRSIKTSSYRAVLEAGRQRD